MSRHHHTPFYRLSRVDWGSEVQKFVLFALLVEKWEVLHATEE